MHYLLRNRLLLRTAQIRVYSTAKQSAETQELVQKLINRAEEYRRELRKHVASTPKYRVIHQSLNTIDYTIGDLQMKRKQLEDLFDTTQKPDIVSLEVLSNGTTHIRPTVFIRTPFSTYLFNCPEGTSRFLPTLRIRPQTIQDFFITRSNWDCFGGLFGVLLGKDTADHITHLHGPSNLKYFLECVRPFADSDYGSNKKQPYRTEERTAINEKYEDNAMTVYYIPMYAMSSDPTDDSSSKACDIAYLLELTEPNKRIDISKLMIKKVPRGPLVGKLKAGESVFLEDGTTVRPEEVFADDSKDHCPNILVVDCDCIEKLESLSTNSYLQKYTNGQKQMGYVVHLTEDLILNEERYQTWMQSFGEQCLHLLANGNGEAVPLTDGLYKQQRMLHEICPDLFPSLFLHDFCQNVMQTVNTPVTNVVHVKPLEKYPMRSTKFSGVNDGISIVLEESELEERVNEDGSILKAIEEYKKEVKKVDLSGDAFPCVSFLGTGSAVPSKYRNVSGHLLQLNSNTSVLIDCGEGTFGQLKSLYGPDKIHDAMIGLSAIFITHAHLDHIGGLMTIVERRIEAFKQRGVEYRPLILACNYNAKKMLVMYRTNFHNLDQYLKFVEIGLYVKDMEEFLKYTSSDLTANVTNQFPKNIFSPKEWNLKSVTAMQVHHTRMANGFVFDTYDGKRIVFSGDTMPCKLLVQSGQNADLLIHEATFGDGFEDDAMKKKHSTTGQAIDIAKQMNAKYLIMSHFSARYPRVPFISDSMTEAGNIGIAFDNMVVPFNKRRLLPLLLPVYRKLFDKELILMTKL